MPNQDMAADQFYRKKIKTKAPTYPDQARNARISGSVKMIAQIESDGRVGKITMVSGPEILRDAAITAVKEWQYEPLVVESTAISQQTLIVINFNIGR
ncbi:energy transducer TonB [Granulicella sp. S190]|uniref:energy transducer TonB n=1 Tax=Granulicella sp. S190 TaxID=1747226 RepID=UPI00131C9C49|nr:energy transducer TonB [Granulicella sp. S190]